MFVTYYMFDNNYNIDTWNIRRQVIRYIVSLKRKQRTKLKTKSCEGDKQHLIFNNVLTSDSDLLQYNTHKGYCVLNTKDYNYKLRNVIGQQDEFKVTKLTWFNKIAYDIFLCSWMISRKLVNYTNIGRAIGCLLVVVYVPFVSMCDSIGSIISFFHTSMVVHPGLDDHLLIHKFIHKCLLSSLSKKQQHVGKFH